MPQAGPSSVLAHSPRCCWRLGLSQNFPAQVYPVRFTWVCLLDIPIRYTIDHVNIGGIRFWVICQLHSAFFLRTCTYRSLTRAMTVVTVLPTTVTKISRVLS